MESAPESTQEPYVVPADPDEGDAGTGAGSGSPEPAVPPSADNPQDEAEPMAKSGPGNVPGSPDSPAD